MKLTKQRLREIIQEELQRLTKEGKAARVSHKIAYLVDKEGKPRDQAVAIAHSMEERGELDEAEKAAKTVGDPPYRERGSTESQAQQMAAGAALSARRGDTPVSKLKGASKELYSGEISTKDLRNLAKLGQKVKGHKSKEPKHRKSLPGHATPAKD